MKKVCLLITLVLVMIASLFSLAGCGKDSNKKDENSIVGSWEHSGYVYNFNADKTGSYEVFGNKMNFTYEDDGSKVSITYKGNTIPGTYEYKIDGKKLIIKDSFGNDVIYERK